MKVFFFLLKNKQDANKNEEGVVKNLVNTVRIGNVRKMFPTIAREMGLKNTTSTTCYVRKLNPSLFKAIVMGSRDRGRKVHRNNINVYIDINNTFVFLNVIFVNKEVKIQINDRFEKKTRYSTRHTF